MPFPVFCNDAAAEKRSEKRQTADRHGKHATIGNKTERKPRNSRSKIPTQLRKIGGRECPWTPPSIAPQAVVGRTSYGSLSFGLISQRETEHTSWLADNQLCRTNKHSRGQLPELYPSTWDIFGVAGFSDLPPTNLLPLARVLGSCSLLRSSRRQCESSPQ
ncbi:LOW QUALITY PROTEIN: hypothetical protein N5P37_011373 [Trichoderma harzianum]|nr:LOW QUALITY PROTEIN: hypothetical protein N5P37_011373 [Trichoderma harzianum]